MDGVLLRQLNHERQARRGCVVVTDLQSGSAELVLEADIAQHSLGASLHKVLRSGGSMKLDDEGRTLFLNAYLPSPRVVVIGAVHISQALAPMASLAGLAVEIIDPRTAFATLERFPAVDLHPEWPEVALGERPLDRYCALAALSHDPKIDDWPLQAALRAKCFYVGALGSRKSHAKRLDRLRTAGIEEDLLNRIHGPIGLPIGASSPAEIAVAILAEIIGAMRSPERPKEPA
jgi:xanthine dehydrogenase accessory factor